MNRRELLSRLGLLVGGTLVGAEAFLSGCSPAGKPSGSVLGAQQIRLLNEIGETILPTTSDSEGAKAAKVGEFMNTIVTEFYNENERKIFLEGLNKLEKTSFLELSEAEKTSFVMNLENEAKQASETNSYLMIKQLTIWGYMTSEVCATQLFDNAPVPGYFDPSLDYKRGDKIMFPNTSVWEAKNKANFHSSS